MADTQAIGTFGVYGKPSDDEIEALALADEYREALVSLLHERHRAMIDYRNDQFPELYAAMVRLESIKAAIWTVEQEIKELHSKVRDRNAVTVDQELRLTDLRSARTAANRLYLELRKPWFDLQKAFREHMKSLEDWKQVKSLSVRKAKYAAIEWPDELTEYAAIWISYDLRQRDLGIAFHQRGLHYTIRGEINAASKPKLSKTGPGMRYEYHRTPREQPWANITLQIPGGLTVRDAIAGKCQSLLLSPKYVNHKASRTHTVYDVSHRIGTKDGQRTIEYTVKFHRELRLDAIIQRWTLKIVGNKRQCIPILKKHGLSKPTGAGLLTYDLTWRVCESGIQVCHFVGAHVNERLIIPTWLMARRLKLHATQKRVDEKSNEFLASRGATPEAGQRQGLAALEVYCDENPNDRLAANNLFDWSKRIARSERMRTKAIRTIEKLYETIVSRVCSTHSEITHDEIDLAKLKRYDTRDLLRHDPIPKKSREYLQAVAPGKLKALLRGYGLASGEVVDDFLGAARETDVFTSYVASLHIATGTKHNSECHRSQISDAEMIITR